MGRCGKLPASRPRRGKQARFGLGPVTNDPGVSHTAASKTTKLIYELIADLGGPLARG